MGVEFAIVRRGVHRNIGMCRGECRHALGCRHQAEKRDVPRTGQLELRRGRDRRAAGGEHRVEQEVAVIRPPESAP